MFAVRATYHTTLQATTAQLVFGRNAILNIKFDANWNLIRRQKQRLIDKNNRIENAKRIPHQYHIGDKVLYKVDTLAKYGMNPYDGPYTICAVHDNGTLDIQKGVLIDTVNIRLVKPFIE